MPSVRDNLINRLTDAYNKEPESNVNKLMQIAALHIQENEDVLNQIAAYRDIDQADGAVLDKIGGNFQQTRGKASDDVYRVLIKSRIRRNLSSGSINDIIGFLAEVLMIDKSQVNVTELWSQGQNASLHVDVPSDAISKTGFTFSQFGQLVNKVVAGGIKAEVLFQGTFSFSSSDASETDTTGFADDALTTGGTLGDAYQPVNDIALPI